MTTIQVPKPSPSAINALQTAALRIGVPICAQRLWDRHLTQDDKDRLGCKDAKEAWCTFGTGTIWAKLRGVTFDRAVCDVALRLNFLTQSDYEWLLREIGESVDPNESMRVAISTNELVVCERPFEVYWRGELIDFDWEENAALRVYFWKLAQHGKHGDLLEIHAFDTGSGPLANWKYRLSKEASFPVELSDLIEPVVPRCQKLNLPPEEIRLYECLPGGAYREWWP